MLMVKHSSTWPHSFLAGRPTARSRRTTVVFSPVAYAFPCSRPRFCSTKFPAPYVRAHTSSYQQMGEQLLYEYTRNILRPRLVHGTWEKNAVSEFL
jgi:hypothetical protein